MQAMKKLISRKWQGNIRELRNCIECLVVLTPPGAEINAEDIPDDPETASPETPADTEISLNLDRSEKELIQRALAECGNNRTAAARALGISRRTLYRKIEEFGI